MKNLYIRVLLTLLPFAGFAQPGNDNCANAIQLSISPGADCTTATDGTVLNATASPGTVGCSGIADDDVWYRFTATDSRHAITISNLSGTNSTMQYEIYEGSCTGTAVFCATSYNNTFTPNVTPGTTYYIRLYTATGPATPASDLNFTICIVTPPPAITVNNIQYTSQQLVQNVFVAQPGLTLSNVTSYTGANAVPGEPNGIAYFTAGNSEFPFEDGIILSTGNALNAQGPNGNVQNAGTVAWPGDTQLNTVIGAAQGTLNSKNATKLEFDFVPDVADMSLSFIYASEEYGIFQCDYGDAFAILLTNNATGVTTNLAVIPGTTLPISSTTVRNNSYNTACASANVAYFGQYYQPGTIDGPINFNGHTVSFTVNSVVVAGQSYHLKIVIADRTDQQFDSALFLKGGSFNIGPPVFDSPYIPFNLPPFAVCDQNNDGYALFNLPDYNSTLTSALSNPEAYTVSYFETLEDAEDNTNSITAITNVYTNVSVGTQTLYGRVSLTANAGVYAVAPVVLVAQPTPLAGTTLNPIPACAANTPVDITVNVQQLAGIDAFEVSYYTSEANANNGTAAISTPSAYIYPGGLVSVWVRIEDAAGTGCYTVLQQAINYWYIFVWADAPTTGNSASVGYVNGAEVFDYTATLNGVPVDAYATYTGLDYGDNNITLTNVTCGGTISMNFVIWPQAPTGETTQTFTQGETLANLEVTGQDIQWFSTPTGGQALPLSSPLQDGATYYAGQFINGYISLQRLAVTTLLTLGTHQNSLAGLRYYPNPVKEVLTVTHATTITGITLINTLGQVVLQQNINSTTASLNLAPLANGIYLMKAETENGEKTVKIVKE